MNCLIVFGKKLTGVEGGIMMKKVKFVLGATHGRRRWGKVV